MNLKAMLLCDDVRIEMGGTLSLIGVYNDRLFIDATDDVIELPRLAFVAVVAGLTGAARVAYRQRIRRMGDEDPPPSALAFEPHEPSADEHNFVLSQSPMVFPGPGTYEVILDVDAVGELATYRYQFQISRRS